MLEHDLVSRCEANNSLWGSPCPFRARQARIRARTLHRATADACSIRNENRERAVASFQAGHSRAQKQETCQPASAGGARAAGTRSHLMINHCQPLFWLKTWWLGETCNEGLLGVCCYEIALDPPQWLEGRVGMT